MPRGLKEAHLELGKEFTNSEGRKATVISLSERRSKDGRVIFVVRFNESGYVFESEKGNLRKGMFKDYGLPTVFGIGYSYKGATKNMQIYKIWNHMLERCYNPNFHAYNRYGGKGVRVSNDWLYFSTFEKEVRTLKNFDLFQDNPKGYSLDKDILGDGFIYSKETCMFASHLQQSHAQKRVRRIAAIKEGVHLEFNSQLECARELGLESKNINQVLKGKRKSCGGYTFEYI